MVYLGDTASIHTEGYTYENVWISVIEHGFITFSVRTCKNAYVLLSFEPDLASEFAYEIILGDDDLVSHILEGSGGYPIATASTPDLLDCNTHRQFWISWTGENGVLSAGTGTRRENSEFLRVAISNQTLSWFTCVAIATSGEGWWEFASMKGDLYLL